MTPGDEALQQTLVGESMFEARPETVFRFIGGAPMIRFADTMLQQYNFFQPTVDYEKLRQIVEIAVKRAIDEIDLVTSTTINSFADEPYLVSKPIPITLRQSTSGVLATFYDANISTSGDTEEEAYSNIRSLILDSIEMLLAESKTLGPEPLRQLSVLRQFVRPL